jgi:hypothetical protein
VANSQGSVLGPLLFLIYLTGINEVIAPFNIQYKLYADDLQLFVTTSVLQLPLAILRMQNCISAVKSWFSSSLLTLNDTKTEAILLGTSGQLSKCTSSHIMIGDLRIPFSSSVRNLGITLDSSLDFSSHISNVCSKSYMRLRLVSRLKRSVSAAHYSMLVNSLVLSNLEFCSSIYLGLPQSSLMKLQRVINSTFRSIHHLRKSDHISDLQRSKGCRSIEQRISTRVATILFVALKWKVPHYISEWITPYSSSLRSNSKCLLVCPRTTTSTGARALSVAGPKLWNSFGLTIRQAATLPRLLNLLNDHWNSTLST